MNPFVPNASFNDYDVRRAAYNAQTNPLGLGSMSRDPSPRVGAQQQPATSEIPAWYEALSMAGVAIGAYHGYKRNDSVGWAIGWGILGGMFPVIVIPVAIAQGISTRKKG